MHRDTFDKKEIRKFSLKERKYKNEIRKFRIESHILKVQNKILKEQLAYLKKQGTKIKDAKSRKKRFQKTKIDFKINSHDDKKDTVLFSELLFDLERLAKEYEARLEYKIKKGSIDVTLIAIEIAIAVSCHLFSIFIVRTIDRLQNTPHLEIRKIDDVAKENIAIQRHRECDHEFQGIVEKTSIIDDGRTGTQFTIRDNHNIDWRYNVFDNGDFRALP